MTRKILFLMISFLLFNLNCEKQQIADPDQNKDRIIVDNDENNLNKRITYHSDVNLVIEPLDISKQKSIAAADLELALRAEVASPEINGQPLHANHVTIQGRYAYVTYHTPDEEYRGGVEIIDIHDIRNPQIISQALFRDTDITIAAEQGNVLYIGEAVDSDNNKNFETPAALEIIGIRNGRLSNSSTRLDLISYNANDILFQSNKIFVTSGSTNGALSVINNRNYTIEQTIPIEGAKAIDAAGSELIVMEGTGTNLHLYDKNNLSFIKTINLGFPNNFQAKAEIDILDGLLFLSAYEEGLKVVDLRTESVVYELAIRNNGHCNAVSVDGNLAFLANGNEGIYILGIDPPNIRKIGCTKFNSSANFVANKGNVLFVATGSEGFKIIEIVN